MSLLLLNHPWKLCFGKPVLVRSSPLVSHALSTSLLQSPPCSIVGLDSSGAIFAADGKLLIQYDGERECTLLDKRVPNDLVYNDLSDSKTITIGASHGWVATLKEDGILRLQDDLNPGASYTDPKRIALPPLVTLPHCQTQVVTNVAMSSSSPEDDEDCVVAVKFLGPQLSFCRSPGKSNSKWINVNIANPCFFSSRVMFSKRDDMFRIPGSGGHLIGSWDLRGKKPKLQTLLFRKLPKLTKTKRELLDSCCKSEHLVDSPSTGETFLVKWYKKAVPKTTKMKTKALMVFKLDEQGNAVYTNDIGDVAIFLSNSEPFCVTASSFPGMCPNKIEFLDVDELGVAYLTHLSPFCSMAYNFPAPYYIPPQH